MVRTGRRYRKSRVEDHYDVVVIGSGIGGLATAALLSKLGKKVCVLEQHYTAGGYTHSYEREGYEWDVGVHYIGEVHKPWSMLRRIFDTISDGKIEWAPMDDCYDRIIIGDESFDFIAGRQNFVDALTRHFPEEAEAIEQYVEKLYQVSKLMPRFFAGKALPKLAAWAYDKTRKFQLPDLFFKSTREVLEGLTSNQKLISVLTGQWGDYGLPPSDSAFLMHAMVAKHYIAGGAFPVGGAWQIAKQIIPVIQSGGGDVFTYAKVDEVILKGKEAKGVRMADGKEIYADAVVSNAGIVPTYRQLLPKEARADKLVAKFDKDVKLSAAHLCLYAGFKATPEQLKLPKTNLWIYPSGDHEGNVGRFMTNREEEFAVTYISFPSAKDPTWSNRYPGKSTVEIIVPVNPEWFGEWDGTQWQKRGDQYDKLKEYFSQRMLEKLYEYIPEARDALDFYELSTPLSTKWFQMNQQGEIYGLDHNLARFESAEFHPATPFKNLYLTGADIVTAGVGGALVGGMMTATVLMGAKGYKVAQLLKKPAVGDDVIAEART